MNKYFAVVYQIGKVASTSIVATLNEIENIEAEQSHFFGKDDLLESVHSLVSPDISDYFFGHNMGQFVRNVSLTRRVNAIRAGRTDERLVVVSLTRDPLDWFRSSVAQDIEGHLVNFKSFLDGKGVDYADDSNAVKIAIARYLNVFSEILEECGGVDKTLKLLKVDPEKVFGHRIPKDDISTRRFFHNMLRPFNWLEKHFEKTLKLKLNDMTEKDGMLIASDETGDFFIFRYEDLRSAMPNFLTILGIENAPKIKKENISKNKKFASEINAAFATPAAANLESQFKKSSFSKQFGYCG